jgi:hypothetical protein
MSSNTGGPAFPRPGEFNAQTGMTLRDYFAAIALQGILQEAETFWAGAAILAYQYADAMLEARK